MSIVKTGAVPDCRIRNISFALKHPALTKQQGNTGIRTSFELFLVGHLLIVRYFINDQRLMTHKEMDT